METTDTLAEVLALPEHSLPVPPASDRRVWTADLLRHLPSWPESELGTPWTVPLAHQYARVQRDGDRDEYEQIVFALYRRLSRAAVMAAATLDPVWVDEAGDGAIVLCELSSWCWPAHDDTRQRHGAVLPTVTDPDLDLGAGEVAAQLAWLDHLLGAQFDERLPGLRSRIRYEVDRRVLTPFVQRRDWHWLGLHGDVHNWCAWIHGNVLVAALRLVDDPARRAMLVALAVEGLERYIASIPPDGAIDEGYSYWWNGACRVWEALDVLAHASGGALGAVPESFRETVAFPHRMHLGGGWYVNHADGWARPPAGDPWNALHRAARRVKDHAAQAHAAANASAPSEAHGLGRLLLALTDPDRPTADPTSGPTADPALDWPTARPTADPASGPTADPALDWPTARPTADPAVSPLPRDVWLPSTQVLVARGEAGSSAGLTLAAKGGHNGEHHNHNDVGSVIVALDGVPVLVDAGRPTYTKQTFGPDRYRIWTMQSSWHNVPEIRGSAQAAGREFTARDVSSTVDGDSNGDSTLSLDLAAAYPRGDIRHWRREARLHRTGGRPTVTITDRWELETGDSDAPTRLHWLVSGAAELGHGRAVINPSAVILTWEPADAPATITVKELDDPMLTEVWGDRLTRLEIDVTAIGAAGTLVMTISEESS